ncbi:hypothetical protein Pmani_009626 [Petrolisthes manimaculis]|uniref:Uncharacterized protein n=1 Tax=Petrolisthes manimaculis TaxID=1843537 RepID=A0AAE1Q3R1_9EUCA|nr:hypothetical protein Pmani_009626 [Petrolisthes manimaculis]
MEAGDSRNNHEANKPRELSGQQIVSVSQVTPVVVSCLQQPVSGYDRGNSPVSTCTVANSHRYIQVSAVVNQPVVENTSIKSPRISYTSQEARKTSSTSENIKSCPPRRTSQDSSSRNWSTSTDSNADCERGNCIGTDLKCRICGKTLPKSKLQEIKTMKTPTSESQYGKDSPLLSVDKSALERDEGKPQLLTRRGSKDNKKLPVLATYPRPAPKKQGGGPRCYSTLLSANNRLKKKTARRTSIEVLYAREPTMPVIDKIRAKRRLSRQNDVSSIELMTLNEGCEVEEGSTKDVKNLFIQPKDKSAILEALQSQIEGSRIFNRLPSPNLRIQELRGGSSTDSCPKAPWNSLETTFSSSQDTEDKYINNESRGNSSQGYHLEHNDESGEYEEKEMDNDEDAEDDQDSQHQEEPPVRLRQQSPEARRNRREGVRRERLRRTRLEAEDEEEEEERHNEIWSTEIVILVALLVYLVCKAVTFLDSLFPVNRRRNRLR